MHNDYLDGDEAALLAVRRSAAAALADLDLLVEKFIENARVVPDYLDLVAENEARANSRRSIELIIRQIAGLPVEEDLAGISEFVGRDRAGMGVPLGSLLRAIRENYRLIWRSMVSNLEPGEERALALGALEVWAAVEHHADRVVVGYQNRTLEMARARDDAKRTAYLALVGCDGDQPDIVQRSAATLGFDASARFVVAVGPRNRPLTELAGRLSVIGVTGHFSTSTETSTLVIQLPPHLNEPRTGWFKGVGCILPPPVLGLAQVPRVARLAAACLEAVPTPQTPTPVREAWVLLAASRLAEFSDDLTRSVLGSLASPRTLDDRRVIEAVEAYLRTGAVAETAELLYCHRNTVFNRLNRFRDITGIDVTDVRWSALVQLALAAQHQRAAADE